jgi:uncharacterized membrane protein
MLIYLIFPTILLLTVIIHYVTLKKLTLLLNANLGQAIKLISIVLSLFLAHLIEIILYAIVYYFSDIFSANNVLIKGSFQENLNALYFSFLAYSSLGSSDLITTGWVRILYGFEALNGLLLITWSASFTFLTMNIVWNCDQCVENKKQ